MQTRLTTTTLSTTEKPLTTCSITALYTTQDGRNISVPLKDDPKVKWLGLSPLRGGGQDLILDRRIRSKTLAFQITGQKEIILEVRLAKSGGGFGDMARFLYLCADHLLPSGNVQFRVLDSYVTVLEGPLRFMDSEEATTKLGRLYKRTSEFDPAKDCSRLGVVLGGIASAVPMVTRQTIGEDGEQTTVKMRRAPRQLGI